MELKLPGVNTWAWRSGMWIPQTETCSILYPEEKLRTKYRSGTTLLFDLYVFANPRRRDHQDEITPVDITAADKLMGARLAPGNRAKEALDVVPKLTGVLAAIPLDASLATDAHDELVAQAVDLLIERPGIKLAIASKLLTIKRPHLVPMMDQYVQDCVRTQRGRTVQALEVIGKFREIITAPENVPVIARLRSMVDREFGIPISAARVVDQLIWFDWDFGEPDEHGVCRNRAYSDWVMDMNRPELGVHDSTVAPASRQARAPRSGRGNRTAPG